LGAARCDWPRVTAGYEEFFAADFHRSEGVNQCVRVWPTGDLVQLWQCPQGQGAFRVSCREQAIAGQMNSTGDMGRVCVDPLNLSHEARNGEQRDGSGVITQGHGWLIPAPAIYDAAHMSWDGGLRQLLAAIEIPAFDLSHGGDDGHWAVLGIKCGYWGVSGGV